LGRFARKARFPKASSDQNRDLIDRSISEIHSEIEQSKKAGCPIGAVLLEPILGRGGVVVPPRGWLRAVRELADRQGVLLIADEIMTGFGRTGKRFAVDHENIKPDLLCVGKSLTGTLPFSACIGSKKVMNAWPKSTGEALHTSTFLGHPLGCVAAIAGIQEIEIKGLAARADRLGKEILEELQAWKKVIPFVDEVRGQGLFLGIVLSKNFDRGIAFEVAKRALAKGVIVLPSGPTGNVLSLSPPLTIGGRQLKWGISVLRDVLVAMS
jgi:4-aminobutyrate aminotransferase-like enzyme